MKLLHFVNKKFSVFGKLFLDIFAKICYIYYKKYGISPLFSFVLLLFSWQRPLKESLSLRGNFLSCAAAPAHLIRERQILTGCGQRVNIPLPAKGGYHITNSWRFWLSDDLPEGGVAYARYFDYTYPRICYYDQSQA